MSEYKKTKYEATIKLIAKLMTEGQYKTAQRFINRLMKHHDDMTEVEKEVVEDQRLYAFNKPARNRVKKKRKVRYIQWNQSIVVTSIMWILVVV